VTGGVPEVEHEEGEEGSDMWNASLVAVEGVLLTLPAVEGALTEISIFLGGDGV
jgi:hypothetical protein